MSTCGKFQIMILIRLCGYWTSFSIAPRHGYIILKLFLLMQTIASETLSWVATSIYNWLASNLMTSLPSLEKVLIVKSNSKSSSKNMSDIRNRCENALPRNKQNGTDHSHLRNSQENLSLHFLEEGAPGFEPETSRSTVECSTTELYHRPSQPLLSFRRNGYENTSSRNVQNGTDHSRLQNYQKIFLFTFIKKGTTSCFLDEFLELGVGHNGFIPPMEFEQVSVSHPITVTYTSGSTGLPKGIIHGSSVLLSVTNFTNMNLDADRDSRWLSIMPAGTIMWLAHLTNHFPGQTIVLYEGSPFLLSPTSFWDLLGKQKVSHVIMFPDALNEMEKRNYVPKKLTVRCALWAGGIIGPYFFKNDEGHNVTVNGDQYRAMITNFFNPELSNHDVLELWFQQDGATCHTARATIDLLKDTFGDPLISRFGPVNWPPRSCDLTPLGFFLWGYVKPLVYADKPQTLDQLEDNIRRVIADIRPQMLEKVIENWTSRLDYIRASRGSHMPEITFKM
ncbi:transposable element Tc3 transposase [Trichonephila clavipes]|nr:transposable element Tc3 transposase [Trichonephila clavipes]